ncbi:hypothetical protein V3470_10425 [Flavobacterium oreochromis]|uniref:Uncharacterized protein n=1 Tax=Flavobacterium oreochromis TaxID=2906078 RepID=A0ABW8PAD7_9FLAO|nr:hypothetical protein [Flavobacterium oreochromis]
MKYFKRLFLLFFVLLSLRLILPFLDLYPYKLTENYYLIGTGSNSYIIKKGFFGKTIVNGMTRNGEWIINKDLIYGLKGDRNNLTDNFFLIEMNKDSVHTFENLISLNNFLSEKGIEHYSMSESENLVHLKFGNGRDRKFKH